MFDMEITSFGSGAFGGAASAGGTGEGTGVGALSLHAASARARRVRERTRIGARKIAEPFAADKEQASPARRSHGAELLAASLLELRRCCRGGTLAIPIDALH